MNEEKKETAIEYNITEAIVRKKSNYTANIRLPPYTTSIAIQPLFGTYDLYTNDEKIGTSDKFARYDFSSLHPQKLCTMQKQSDIDICGNAFAGDWISEVCVTLHFHVNSRLDRITHGKPSKINVAIYCYTFIC